MIQQNIGIDKEQIENIDQRWSLSLFFPLVKEFNSPIVYLGFFRRSFGLHISLYFRFSFLVFFWKEWKSFVKNAIYLRWIIETFVYNANYF